MKQKLLTLATLLLCAVSGAWADPTVTVGTYTTCTVSEDFKTSTWAFNVVKGSSVDVKTETTDNEMVLVATSTEKIKMQTSNYASFNQNTELYIPVPAGAAGTVSVTISSSDDSRYFQLWIKSFFQMELILI